MTPKAMTEIYEATLAAIMAWKEGRPFPNRVALSKPEKLIVKPLINSFRMIERCLEGVREFSGS